MLLPQFKTFESSYLFCTPVPGSAKFCSNAVQCALCIGVGQVLFCLVSPNEPISFWANHWGKILVERWVSWCTACGSESAWYCSVVCISHGSIFSTRLNTTTPFYLFVYSITKHLVRQDGGPRHLVVVRGLVPRPVQPSSSTSSFCKKIMKMLQ
jgi:hypothetical protein